MKKIWSISVAAVLIVLMAGSCGQQAELVPMPDQIQLYFFYDEACGSCDGTAELYDLFNEHAGDVKEQYPYTIYMHNVFGTGQEFYETTTNNFGISRENLSFPVLLVNGKVYSGKEAIAKNIKEAFLTAGEDIFDYEYVYYPANDADKPLFLRYGADKKHSTMVYFYRITCDECNQVKPVIDNMPSAITVDGRETDLDIVRLNTRSGNNGDRVTAFFEAYDVPQEKQMVPIVFLRDTYLAGYEEISQYLMEQLEDGGGLDFIFPNK